MARRADSPGPAAATVLPCGADGERFRCALLSPGSGCLESGTEEAWPALTDGFGMVVTTRTAFTMDLGAIIADAVIGRGWMPGERRVDLLVALREAMANALLHGNLQLASADQATPDQFLAHAARLTQRLADPAFGDRPLAVRVADLGGVLEIVVEDYGTGFDVEACLSAIGRPSTGNGLALMRSRCQDVRYEEGGRRCVLHFDHDR